MNENIENTYLALRIFANNEVNELQYAVEKAEIVLNKGRVLVTEAESEHEKNLVKKIVFRNFVYRRKHNCILQNIINKIIFYIQPR